jgi:hypothetical protein
MHQPMETNIKVIKLDNGDDIVCSFPKDQLEEKTGLIRLVKPLLIKYVPQLTTKGLKDYVALIKWAAYTNDEIITIPIRKIMTITNASSEMAKSFNHMSNHYKKIESPKRKDDYDRLLFSKEENDKINEIFDEFSDDDTDGTLH